jgi:hypothetical protein
MSGDDERPGPQDAIERQLLPLVLADFERIIRISSDFAGIQRRRLAAIMRDEKTSDEDECTCEELRREFAGVMEKIHLNGHCIDQLATEQSETAAQIVATLGPGEERVLRMMRPGQDADIDRALEKVGRQFSKTRKRIREIETTLRKLKQRSSHADPGSGKPIDAATRNKAVAALYESPLTMDVFVQWRESLLKGIMRLSGIIDLDATYTAYHPGDGGNGQDGEGKDD